MFEILTNKKNGVATMELKGRLDTTTSPKFESELNNNVEGINELVLDLSKLEYISSAGLRVLLTAQKIMNKQGKMIVRNTSKSIKEIFEMTGFSSILTIE